MDGALDDFRHGIAHGTDARHSLHGMPGKDLLDRCAGEWRFAHQHLVKDAAETVLVGACIEPR